MLKQIVCLTLCVLLVTMIARAEAEDEPKHCPCKVTKERKLVCGSDNKTYSNWRKLACKNKCDGTNITVVHNGKCAEDTSEA
ncbi:hypothetical protein TSAR_012022 [Trichomalopsis sarcophagae]|uniref:Kazal-like domain-containing protein n=1 Tax=Trichomalopsis sarcophagae TaxID=543379 RepID=A0A232F6U8_9HYME|nr:hypothetical protein TSAR_012022 [Trichomalopsis sarcophagae]